MDGLDVDGVGTVFLGGVVSLGEQSTAVIANARVVRSTAVLGGALYLSDGVLEVHDSYFADNTAFVEGGAICSDAGEGRVEVTNSTFERNVASAVVRICACACVMVMV